MTTYRIIGRRWFQRSYGNTYHTAEVRDGDNKIVFRTPVKYGYGSTYEQTALDEMQRRGMIEPRQDGRPYGWGDLDAFGITSEVIDVPRKRDLLDPVDIDRP